MVGGTEKDKAGAAGHREPPRSQPQSGSHTPIDQNYCTCLWFLLQGTERVGDLGVDGEASRELLMWVLVITRGAEVAEEPQVWALDPL